MKKDNPNDKCDNCEFSFPTGLDDESKEGCVWCCEAQAWKEENDWCGLYRYDRELPTRRD